MSRADPYLLHRWLRVEALPPRPVQEIDALMGFMDSLRFHLGESGFVGAQWQVDRRTLVATANFLHNGDRWVALDLESGVCAVTVPHYLKEGLCLGRVPLFDDTDFARLRSYIEAHADALTTYLGPMKGINYRLPNALLSIASRSGKWQGYSLPRNRRCYDRRSPARARKNMCEDLVCT